MIDDFIKLIPESLRDKPGSVFFSSRHSFSSKSDLYILGANPGGEPPHSPKFKDTIQGNITRYLHEVDEYYAPYRDEPWGRHKPGKHAIQRGVLHLIDRVGKCPSQVPASEVVFLKSKNLKKLRGNFNEIAKVCWPFHEAVIEALEVNVIACLGKDAGQFVRRTLGANQKIDEFQEGIRRGKSRGWKSHSYRNESGIFVVQLAHPSRSEWKNEKCDPTHLVVNALRVSSQS